MRWLSREACLTFRKPMIYTYLPISRLRRGGVISVCIGFDTRLTPIQSKPKLQLHTAFIRETIVLHFYCRVKVKVMCKLKLFSD